MVEVRWHGRENNWREKIVLRQYAPRLFKDMAKEMLILDPIMIVLVVCGKNA